MARCGASAVGAWGLLAVLAASGCGGAAPAASQATTESASGGAAGGEARRSPEVTAESSSDTRASAAPPMAPPSVQPSPPPPESSPAGSAAPMSSGGVAFGAAGSGAGPLATGGSRANYGTRSLNAGFQPDPLEVSVVPGGSLQASDLSLGSGCVGYVTREPDFILRLSGPSPSLRIYVTSDADTTLVVNDASGQWHCNDDSYGGHDPTVDLAAAGAGQYDVWVGTYHAGEQAPATLHITERDAHP